MRKSSRLGFGLVEVLVLLAVLAVMAMLLIPAIQKVREAAYGCADIDNLRQCAVAIHNYNGVYNRLPNASSTGGMYTRDPRSMWFHLLPYVEQDIAYRDNIHNAVVPAFLAPLDPYIREPEGKTNFAANIRLFGYETLGKDVADGALNAAGAPSGTTLSGRLKESMSSGLKLTEIADGASNVIMLATRYADCGSPLESTYYSASPTGTFLADGGFLKRVGLPSRVPRGAFFGAGSHDQPADRTSIGATFQVAPTLAECRADDSVFGHSFSTGGMRAALADASVRSIHPTMSAMTFCRALCPSDGLSMANDWIDN